jgi:ring-1,2-phenylacetyl-CoA epoxidase subunit PaaC
MNHLFEYILRIGDDSLILGQRLSEWCGHGPILEEDIATTNISLDLIGQATNFLTYAAEVENAGRDADNLAFLRIDREYKNVVLAEQPNGDFGDTMVRQFLFDAFRKLFFERLQHSKDEQLAAIAEKSLKETRYHLKHSSEWVIRLGDGTEESHNRVQNSLNTLWRYRTELFYMDEIDNELIKQGIAVDLNSIRNDYDSFLTSILNVATLVPPTNNWEFGAGRTGKHSEHLGHLLAEMQYMQRAYPNMEW